MEILIVADHVQEEAAKEEVVTEEIVVVPAADAMAAAVNELQSMLEEGLNDATDTNQNPNKLDSSKTTPKLNPSSDPSIKSVQGRTRKISEKESSSKNAPERRRSSGKQGPDSDGRKKDGEATETRNKPTSGSARVEEVTAKSVDHLLTVGEEVGIAKDEIHVGEKKLSRTGRSSKDGNPSNPGDRQVRTASNEEKNAISAGARPSRPSKEGKTNTEAVVSQEEPTPDVGGEVEESSSAADERKRNAVKRYTVTFLSTIFLDS